MAPRPTKSRIAFTTWHPQFGLNTSWIRPRAKDIREANGRRWENIKKMGWRVVRVTVHLQ